MSDVTGKTFVVTGGNSGIGRATADLLLRQGAEVHVLDRVISPDAEEPGRFGYELDARDEQALNAAVESVVERAGSIDALINAVGVEYVEEVVSTRSEEWDRVLDTNLKSYFLATKAAIPHMGEGGAIVNVASQLAMVGASRFSAYTASKAGILGMTRSLALELAPKGIRVNAVCPGAVDTPLLRRQFEDGDGPQGSMQDLVGMHPVGRLGRPEEIAAPIAFLAGEDASFMTGSEVVVDGGYIAW